MNKLNVEYMSIETLIPYINNLRKNDKEIVSGAESVLNSAKSFTGSLFSR